MKKQCAYFLLLAALWSGSAFADKVVFLPLDNTIAVAAHKGWADEAFAPFGYKVKTVDLSTVKISGATAAMLDRGDLNFSSAMAYMATDYKINGFDTKVIWAAQPTIRKSVLVFGLKDSPYKSIADLKGQTIGSIRYCCGYAAALEIFNHAGYNIDTDLKKGAVRVWVAPSSTAIQQALLAGKIQGASDHLQVTANTEAYLQGLYRVIDTLPENSVYQRYGGRAYYFGTVKWIDAHPELAQAFARLVDKTRSWVMNPANREEAAQILAKDLRIPIGVARFQNANQEWSSLALSERSWDKTVESLKQCEKEYRNLGEPLYLKKSLNDKDLEAFVDKRFFEGGQYSAFGN
jgi:ABC-type nitrate/sulfonate/bicarbonate transport system substrate-binding protein